MNKVLYLVAQWPLVIGALLPGASQAAYVPIRPIGSTCTVMKPTFGTTTADTCAEAAATAPWIKMYWPTGTIVCTNVYPDTSTPCYVSVPPTPSIAYFDVYYIPVCPINSTWNGSSCFCDTGWNQNPTNNGCYNKTSINLAKLLNTSKPQSCTALVQTIRAITPLLGAETHTVETGIAVGGQSLRLTWDNRKVFAAAAIGVAPKSMGNMPALGALWESSLHKNLKFADGGFGANLIRGNGTVVSFKYNTTTSLYEATPGGNDTLIAVSGNYIYTSSGGVIETYNVSGQLLSVADAAGNTLTYTYSTGAAAGAPAAGYLMKVADNTGRTVSFAYTLASGGVAATDGLLTSITNSSGQVTTLGYDSNQNLNAITWPDGKTQGYVYENSSLPWALTGYVDENTSRYITWGYDGAGRAVSSVLAGGVEPYSITYTTPPGTSMVQTYDATSGITTQNINGTTPSGVVMNLPNGQSVNIGSTTINGLNMATGLSQPAGSGCAASNSASAFDANGNLNRKDDFQGQRVCYAYDAKNQEVTRVEGLNTSTDCATVLPTNTTVPVNARKNSTTYHPDWRIPTQVTAPGAITTSVYQGQPDPFNGNAIANCTTAPSMPNGKPIPVLCKQVAQATLSNGNLDSATPNAVSQYTYDASGRALTRTDTMNRTTAYAYYADTAFTGSDPIAIGHTLGDLQSITGPSGLVTTYDLYDKLGRALQITDPKGVVTQMTYTPRGWVSTVSTTAPGQSARLTTYTYDNVGQLTGVLAPDGTSTTMSYDAAHRLVGASDAKGNSVTYTLDNMGNRTGEQIKDPQGVLQLQMQRNFDALNRVQQYQIGAMQ